MDDRSRYDTDAVAPPERLAYWQDAVCDSYVQLGCEARGGHAGFRGVIEIARHSVLSISTVGGKAHTVRRRRRDIRRSTEACFLLSLQTARQARVSQFGETAVLGVGDMALYASTDPYELVLSDDFAQTVVQLPKEKLLARLPNAEAMAGRRIDGGSAMGRLVGQSILAFAHHAGAPDPVLRVLVQETLLDLIATGLAAQGPATADVSSSERHVMLRVRHFVREHLADPTLSRQRVADEIGLSVRRLNAMFAKEDTSLSALIRHARLSAIAEQLGDARYAGLSIGEIAFRHGFQNFQHFSKSFRAHHGTTPRDYRAAAAAERTATLRAASDS